MAEESSAFKNLINATVINTYAQVLASVDPQFNSKAFKKISAQLDALELKARVQLISTTLKKHLGDHYPRSIEKLLKVSRSGKLSQFELWPITEFIRDYGLEHFDLSFQAMQDITTRFTSEFAVRPFLIQQRERGFQILEECAVHKNVHVRRWASEGSRPYLPWGEKIKQSVVDPSANLKILEILRFDPELYVRKSVANHLNDIAKDHPDLVIQTLKRWQKDVPSGYEKEFQFLLSRALRTLVKDRHPKALQLMGVSSKQDAITLSQLRLSSKMVKFGSPLSFSFEIKHRKTAPQTKIIIDYAIHFQKSNGKLAPKVFKLKNGVLRGSEVMKIEKKHPFKPITTRIYYSGLHRLEIFVNGVSMATADFELRGVPAK